MQNLPCFQCQTTYKHSSPEDPIKKWKLDFQCAIEQSMKTDFGYVNISYTKRLTWSFNPARDLIQRLMTFKLPLQLFSFYMSFELRYDIYVTNDVILYFFQRNR